MDFILMGLFVKNITCSLQQPEGKEFNVTIAFAVYCFILTLFFYVYHVQPNLFLVLVSRVPNLKMRS